MSQQKTIFTSTEPTPFNTVGLFTFLRTYARRHNEEDPHSTIETWEECLSRVIHACDTQLKVGFTKEEELELFNLLYNLKCSVAGRFMWQLGTKTVDRLGLPSLQNCAFTTIDSPVRPFSWLMSMLMLGAGVGYRILPEDVDKLPIVNRVEIKREDTSDADFIVPDSREGWTKLLARLLKAHFYSGKTFTYSCKLLRSKGAPIKSFGGLASGPDVLCEGIMNINTVLNKRAGKKARPVDVLDMCNIIGMIVVSGNVRRSAQIALGDCKDRDYLKAKDWSTGNIPNWRAFSNNSVICNDIKDIINDQDFWKGYYGNGEPYGLINLNLMKSCGRIGETQYPDPDVQGTNPCCFSEDTLIAVADDRNAVSIKQLAIEDDDVQLYSLNPFTGKMEIKWGRNPRISGENQELMRIILNDDSHIDVTCFHKFYTTDNHQIRADELQVGDYLPSFVNYENGKKYTKQQQWYWRSNTTKLNDAREKGLNPIVVNNQICFVRACEYCKSEFQCTWNSRGTSYCSDLCCCFQE